MFTVLHKSNRGVEMLYNADHVQFIPGNEKVGDTGGVHMLCGPGDAAPGVHVGSIKDGEVFVMNDKGATVARYFMPEYGPASAPPPDYFGGTPKQQLAQEVA